MTSNALGGVRVPSTGTCRLSSVGGIAVLFGVTPSTRRPAVADSLLARTAIESCANFPYFFKGGPDGPRGQREAAGTSRRCRPLMFAKSNGSMGLVVPATRPARRSIAGSGSVHSSYTRSWKAAISDDR